MISFESVFITLFLFYSHFADIVFCRTWFKVDVPRFYAPVTTALLPLGEKSQWRGMKTVGQLKREKGLHATANPDHSYTPIVRKEKAFKPLTISKNLQKALPYKFKPKEAAVNERLEMEELRVPVIRSPHEEKVARMMKMIKASYDMKLKKQAETKEEARKKSKKLKDAIDFKRLQKQKETRRKMCRSMGKAERAEKNKH